MAAAGKCPECGLEVGGDSNVDPYKHAVTCMHIDPSTHDRMIAQAEHESEERGRRVRILLGYASPAQRENTPDESDE